MDLTEGKPDPITLSRCLLLHSLEYLMGHRGGLIAVITEAATNCMAPVLSVFRHDTTISFTTYARKKLF